MKKSLPHHCGLTLLGSISLCVIAFGCDSQEPLSSKPSGRRSGETKAAEIVLVDRLSRTVCLSKVPTRIVSLAPATTELMFAIGAGHLLVGATDHCNFPLEAIKIARIGGGTMQGISHEIIASLKPELILGKWDTHQPLIASFERIQIPMLAIGPDSIDQLYEEAAILGRATGHEAEAKALIESMKQRMVALTSWVESVPMDQRRRVFYEVWDEPLMTVGPKSFIGELLEKGGMRNIFNDATVSYLRISDEVLLDRDPAVILVPSTHRERVNFDILSKRKGWDRIAAVRNKQVFFVDGDKVSRCGPRMLDALEEMIMAVYPEKLSQGLSHEGTVR